MRRNSSAAAHERPKAKRMRVDVGSNRIIMMAPGVSTTEPKRPEKRSDTSKLDNECATGAGKSHEERSCEPGEEELPSHGLFVEGFSRWRDVGLLDGVENWLGRTVSASYNAFAEKDATMGTCPTLSHATPGHALLGAVLPRTRTPTGLRSLVQDAREGWASVVGRVWESPVRTTRDTLFISVGGGGGPLHWVDGPVNRWHQIVPAPLIADTKRRTLVVLVAAAMSVDSTHPSRLFVTRHAPDEARVRVVDSSRGRHIHTSYCGRIAIVHYNTHLPSSPDAAVGSHQQSAANVARAVHPVDKAKAMVAESEILVKQTREALNAGVGKFKHCTIASFAFFPANPSKSVRLGLFHWLSSVGKSNTIPPALLACCVWDERSGLRPFDAGPDAALSCVVLRSDATPMGTAINGGVDWLPMLVRLGDHGTKLQRLHELSSAELVAAPEAWP